MSLVEVSRMAWSLKISVITVSVVVAIMSSSVELFWGSVVWSMSLVEVSRMAWSLEISVITVSVVVAIMSSSVELSWGSV